VLQLIDREKDRENIQVDLLEGRRKRKYPGDINFLLSERILPSFASIRFPRMGK